MKFLRSIAVGLAAGMLLFGLACGESPTEPDPDPLPVPTTLEAAGGDAQNGTVGTALAMPLTARVLDANGRAMADVAVTWSVVTGGGTVTAATARTSSDGTITATWTLGPTVGAQSVRATTGTLARSFTGTAAADRPATITPTPDSLLLDAVGDSLAATYAVKDRFGNALSTPALQFAFGSAADSGIAAVGSNGMVKAKAAGRVLLRVKSDTATLQLPVRVAPVVTALGLPAAPACLAAVGAAVRLTASPADRNGNAVAGNSLAWTSRDAGVAVVDTSGVVTARANGSAWIVATATTERGAKSDSVQVCVAQAVAEVTASPASDTLRTIGSVRALTAAAKDAQGAPVADAAFTWTSLTPAIVSLDTAQGASVSAKAVAPGAARIVVTSGAAADTISMVVHQHIASIAIGGATGPLLVGDSLTLAAEARDSSGAVIGGRPVTWTSRSNGVATVGTAGKVRGIAEGTAWIVAAMDAARDSVLLAVEAGCRDVAHVLGGTVTGSWTAGDCRDNRNAPVDRYVLTLTAQQHFRATVDGAAGRQLRMRRGSSTGEYIGFMSRRLLDAPATNPASMDYLLAPGTYVLEVSAPDSTTRSDYTLSTSQLTAISCTTVTWATLGVQVAGELAAGDCTFNGAYEDVLLVHVPVGKRMLATMTTTAVRPAIAIKDDRSPTGPILAREYRATPGAVQAAWTTDYAGGHLVIATSYGAAETGTYTLRLDEIDAANSCEVAPLVLGNVTLARWETTDCAQGGGKVYDSYESNGADTTIRARLVGPAGKVLEAYQDGDWVGGNLPRADTAALETHWFLRAGGNTELRPVAPNAGGDSYRLSTTVDTNITACRNVWAQRGARIPGQRLETTDCSFNGSYEDRILIHLEAGTTFAAEMTSAEFAPALYLRDAAAPPGTILVGDVRTNPGSARLSWIVATSGVYELVASSAVDGATGAYTLVMPDSLPTLPVAQVTMSPDGGTISVGDTLTLSATTKDRDGRTLAGRAIVWATSDPAVATVDTAGRTVAVGAGRVTITATSEGKSDTAVVVVEVRAVGSVQLATDSLTLTDGDTSRLVVTVRDDRGDVVTDRIVTWTSSDAAVAAVDAGGLVTAHSAGTTWIHAATGGHRDSTHVTVLAGAVADVNVVPDSLNALAGDTVVIRAVTLDATGDTLTGRAITWSVSDTTLAWADTGGVIATRAAGRLEVTATSEGKSETAVVVIAPRPITVALAPDTLRIAARSTGALTATLTDDRGHVVTGPAITWTSDDAAIATVSGSGAVTGVAEGTIWIRAASGTSVDSVVVVVGPVPVASIHVVPDSSVAYLGATRTLSAVTLAAEGDTLTGRTVTWSSLDATRATVDAAGVVTPRALGTVRIVAASEGKADTAVVTVRSPITRIVIAPDTLTLTAVGATQTYLATAYDTADVAMPGVTFTWSSANPLVATVSPGPGVSTTATAEGAGLTQIFAQALGAAGAASLRVGQFAATIDASPDTVYVTVGGRATLSAAARDGNGAVMPGASFVWRKDNAQVTLDTLTGAISGVTLGASRVWATKDGVTSDSVVVIVTNTAAPKLTFSNSTYTVGRFGSVSIPVYLSTSPTSPVTVLLSVSDTTRGRFSSTTLRFNPGQTEQNASVSGLTVGGFTIVAADSAGTFGADTAGVQVSIKAELQIPQSRSSYYEGNSYYPTIIVGDRVPVDLRLSDPAPAGGLYFTASGGATSEAEQQTVFVPAGQLATTFFINAVTPGADPVTAYAAGTTSASHLMRVVPANFMIWSDPGGYGRVPYTIGLGQVNHPTDGYSLGIRTPLTVIAPLSAEVLLGTPGIIGEAAASVVIATGTARTGYGFRATALGRTTIAASASGWTSDVDTIVVTRPKVKLSNSSYGDSTYVGVGRGRMYATLTDSIDRAHPAADTVRFRFWSGDTTVVKVESDSGVILPGQTMPPGQYLYMQAVGGGSTWIYSGADGYITDSIAVRVRMPKITATGTLRAAPGYLTPGSIQISAPQSQGDLWFQLQSSDTLVAAFDSTLATYYGSTSATSATSRSYMEGTATVIVSAPGYEPDTVTVVSANGRVWIGGNSTYGDRYDLQMFQEGARLSASGLDASSYLNARDTTYFTFTVMDTSIVRMDSTAPRRLPGEQLGVSLPIVPVDAGETQVIVSAPNLAPDTMRVVVTGVQLTVSAYRNQLGTNQTTGDQGIGVNIPTVRGTPVVVRLSSRNTAIATLSSDSIVIPAGRTNATFGWTSGSTLGKDTIIVSATGYAPDTLAIEVRTPKILPGGFYGIESAVRTTQTGISGRPYLGVDNDGNPVGSTSVPVTLHVASSDSSVMVPDSAKLHFMPGQTVPTVPLRFINPGQAYLIYTDSAGVYLPDSTNKVTVMAPELGFRMGGSYHVGRLNIGMGQQTDTSSSGSLSALTIVIDDAVAGAPLVISLASSDTSVVKVPATVTIPIGAKIVTVPLYAQDTTGSIAVYATADGYLQGRTDVDVTQPKLGLSTTAVMTVPRDTTYRNGLTVYSLSENGGNRSVSEDLVLTLTSSDPTVVSLDHSTATIPAGTGQVYLSTVRYHKPGTATITVTDPRTGFTTYLPVSQLITVNP